MITASLLIGKEFIAYNQGTNITPIEKKVKVLTSTEDTVYYRLEGERQIKDTPIERFISICRLESLLCN